MSSNLQEILTFLVISSQFNPFPAILDSSIQLHSFPAIFAISSNFQQFLLFLVISSHYQPFLPYPAVPSHFQPSSAIPIISQSSHHPFSLSSCHPTILSFDWTSANLEFGKYKIAKTDKYNVVISSPLSAAGLHITLR